MPTESAKMFPVGNGAGEDTSVKGGKRTRTGVAHRSRSDSGDYYDSYNNICWIIRWCRDWNIYRYK